MVEQSIRYTNLEQFEKNQNKDKVAFEEEREKIYQKKYKEAMDEYNEEEERRKRDEAMMTTPPGVINNRRQ